MSEKMEALARLAGGMAHDFNNLLAAIGGYSEIILGSLDASSPIREDIEEIRRAARLAGDLTRKLQAFSRKGVLRPEPLDLNALVSRHESELRRLEGSGVRLELRPAPGLGAVEADPEWLGRVLMHLAVNAREAMPEGGRLAVAVEGVTLDSERVHGGIRIPPGRYARLSVEDSGRGMDPETRSSVFEPFFTTKKGIKGAGLGLSTVWGVVGQSGGRVAFESEPGRGTVFHVYLPLAGPGEGRG